MFQLRGKQKQICIVIVLCSAVFLFLFFVFPHQPQMAIIIGDLGHAFSVTTDKTTINQGESITFTVSLSNYQYFDGIFVNEIRWYDNGVNFASTGGDYATTHGGSSYTFYFNDVGNRNIMIEIYYTNPQDYRNGYAEGVIPITVAGATSPTPSPTMPPLIPTFSPIPIPSPFPTVTPSQTPTPTLPPSPTASPPPAFAVSLIINAGVGGSTSPVPGVYVKLQGHSVVVSAVPDVGYYFDYWDTSDGLKFSQTITVVLDVDKYVTVHFRPVPSSSPTVSPTPLPTQSPTSSPVPTSTPVPTLSPSPTPSPVPTASPTPSATLSPSPSPTLSPSPTVSPDVQFPIQYFAVILVATLLSVFAVIVFTSKGKR